MSDTIVLVSVAHTPPAPKSDAVECTSAPSGVVKVAAPVWLTNPSAPVASTA